MADASLHNGATQWTPRLQMKRRAVTHTGDVAVLVRFPGVQRAPQTLSSFRRGLSAIVAHTHR